MQGVYVTFNGTSGTPKTSLGGALTHFGIKHLLRSKRFSAGVDLTTPLPSGPYFLETATGNIFEGAQMIFFYSDVNSYQILFELSSSLVQ